MTTAAAEGATGLTTYTCTSCGATESQTIPATVAIAACDHNASEAAPSEDNTDEGHDVTFEVGEGVSVNVYYTQDYAAASETSVTSAVSRNADTGEPDSTGDGQVNFAVVVAEGYTFEGLTTADISGSYKNLKDVSTSDLPYTYRITKVMGPLTVTVAATSESGDTDATDLSAATLSDIADQVWYGEAVEPEVSVTLGGQTLAAGSDYELSYADNNAVGSATVTASGIGAYTGSTSTTFDLVYPFTDVTEDTSHLTDILWLAKAGVSTGWGTIPDATFKPNDNVKRGDMAAFLFRLANLWGVLDADDAWSADEDTMATFTDVSSATAHCQAIWWLADQEISTGWVEADGSKTFRPNDYVKRGDVAAFIGRLASKAGKGTEVMGDQAAFVDVTSATSHCTEIWWLAGAGISTGWHADGGAVFLPNDNVKRGDMAAFLSRLNKLD